MLALAQREPRASSPPAAAMAPPVSVTWPPTGYGNNAFTGREWDPETGLYYYRARYYDPKIGRFISEDPIGFSGGINFYGYALGNPINNIDPDGLDVINVTYVGYPVNTGRTAFGRPVYLPLGHAAAVSVNEATGQTRYYEYGRYPPDGDFGRVVRRSVPDVQIGKDGLPTPESLKRLYDFISENYGKGYPVWAEYDAAADYQAAIEYAERMMRDRNRPPYSIPGNTCYTFADKVRRAGHR